MISIIYVLLIQLCCCQLNNNIQKPLIKKSILDEEMIIIKSYQTVTLQLPPVFYTIGAQIYQRRHESDKLQQLSAQQLLLNYKDQFTISDRCKYNDPDFQINQLFAQKLQFSDSLVKDYYMDHLNKKAFIVTDKQIQVYSIRSEAISLAGIADFPFSANIQNLFFFDLVGQTMVTDGFTIYKVVTLNTGLVEVILWKKLTYSQTDNKEKINFKKIMCLGHLIFVLADKFYTLFQFSEEKGQIQQKFLKRAQIQNLTSGTFIDAIWRDSGHQSLYILTDMDGIIQVRDFLTEHKIIHHQIGQIGVCQSFIMFDDVFEIVFRESGKGARYVAEYFYDKSVNKVGQVKQSRLLLNRFYDKVQSIIDIEYFFNHIFIIGDKEFKVYGPAINRYFYLETGFQQAPYTGYNYDFKWLEVIQDFNRLNQITVLGFSDDSLNLLRITNIAPNITCILQGATDLWVKSYGSDPAQTNRVALSRGVFQMNLVYHLIVKRQYSVEIALIITFGLILLILLCVYAAFVLNVAIIDQVNKKVRQWTVKLENIRKKKQGADGTLATFGNQKEHKEMSEQANQNVTVQIMQEK